MQLPLGRRTYKARALDVSAQNLINCYPEFPNEPARTNNVIYGVEGLVEFADTGEEIITGQHTMADELYAVASDRLVKIAADGTPTDLGEIPGSGRPDMDASDFQLAIVRDGRGFIWDGNTLDEILDANFQTASSVTYIDGFFVFTVDGEQVFFHSDVFDGKTYDPLAFATAGGKEDNLRRAFSDHRDLILAGERSMEIWYNSGTSPLSFARRGDSFIERGLAAKHAIAAMDNSFYWLGDDNLFYRLNGYQPQVISDETVAQAVQEMTVVEDAIAFTYSYARHKFFCCVFPNAGRAFVYDSATDMWHERETWGRRRWRANAYAEAYGNRLIGDAFSGKIYKLDDQTYSDGGEVLERVTVTPPVHGNDMPVFMRRLEYVFEGGVGLLSGQGSEPTVMVDWSDDGGRSGTFKDERQVVIGKIGEYQKKAVLHQLGRFFSRSYRVRMTDPVPFSLVRIDAQVKAGRV